MLNALRDRLARYKQPKRVIFAEDLPRNTMGKVQKNLLRDKYSNLYTQRLLGAPTQPGVVPGSETDAG